MKKLFIILATISVFSCSSQSEDLKSPCVSLEGGPCGPRIPVNKILG